MKDGWKYEKFEDCLLKIPKAKQLKTNEYSSEGQYPIVSQEEAFISGYTDREDFLCHIPSPVVVFGDHTRVLKYVNFDFVVGADGVKILLPKDNLNAKFFCYYLKWYNIPSLGYSRHYKLLKELEIPIPPLSEQHAVVEELDLLNAIIDKKKAELEELDKLAQSVFYDMFGDPVENDKGWEVKKLGELVELKNGLNFTPKDNGNCVRIIGVADFKDLNVVRNVRLIGFKSIEGEVAPDYYLQDGDILIVRSNGSKELVGRNLMIYTNGELVTYSGFCIRCRIQNMSKLSSVYLNAFLSKREIRKILRQEGRGANISNINQKILSSQIVPLPPLPLQQQFASRISALEKMKEKVTESMTETQTLLAATMDKYFG